MFFSLYCTCNTRDHTISDSQTFHIIAHQWSSLSDKSRDFGTWALFGHSVSNPKEELLSKLNVTENDSLFRKNRCLSSFLAAFKMAVSSLV